LKIVRDFYSQQPIGLLPQARPNTPPLSLFFFSHFTLAWLTQLDLACPGPLLVKASSSPTLAAQQLAQWPLQLGARRRVPDRRAVCAICPCHHAPGRRANPMPHKGGRTDPMAQVLPPPSQTRLPPVDWSEGPKESFPIGDRILSKANQSLTASNHLEIGSLART
jgi:hypothetical protein